MAEFSESEVAALKAVLAAKDQPNIKMVNGRPFDLSRVRTPLISEDNKHEMYANPRLMLKNKTKPSFVEDQKNGVEYMWIPRGSIDRVPRRSDYRPVLREEVDTDSPYCRLDESAPIFNKETGQKIDIVISGGMELYEVGGQSAYLLMCYGAEKHLQNVAEGEGENFQRDVVGTGVKINRAERISNPAWEPTSQGNLSDPSTWGAGTEGKYV